LFQQSPVGDIPTRPSAPPPFFFKQDIPDAFATTGSASSRTSLLADLHAAASPLLSPVENRREHAKDQDVHYYRSDGQRFFMRKNRVEGDEQACQPE